MPEEIIYLLAVSMISSGHIAEGVWVLTRYDIFGREQDIGDLSESDLVFDGDVWALMFGVAAKGQSSKTAVNQGTVICSGLVTDLPLGLHAWKQQYPKATKKLFVQMPRHFAKSGTALARSLASKLQGRHIISAIAVLLRILHATGQAWKLCKGAPAGKC